jgi:hypothetical protein
MWDRRMCHRMKRPQIAAVDRNSGWCRIFVIMVLVVAWLILYHSIWACTQADTISSVTANSNHNKSTSTVVSSSK